jgi:transposase
MFFMGIDVSKAKLDCSLLLDVTSGKRKTKTVTNSKAGGSDLLAWCVKQAIIVTDLHAIMEGTGVYHEQAALALFDADAIVSIVNPAQAKDFGKGLGVRTKTDGIDSLVLAKYGALLSPQPWSPPTQEARELQALLSRRDTLWGTRAIAQDLQRERNRLEKTETTELPPLIQQSILDTIAFLEQQLEKLQRNIDQHIGKHPSLKKDRDLLTSIPAVGPQVGNHMLAVLHTHPFRSAEQFAPTWALCLWSGNPVPPLKADQGYRKLGLPTSAPNSTWRRWLRPGTTRTSKIYINACKPMASPRCRL